MWVNFHERVQTLSDSPRKFDKFNKILVIFLVAFVVMNSLNRQIQNCKSLNPIEYVCIFADYIYLIMVEEI